MPNNKVRVVRINANYFWDPTRLPKFCITLQMHFVVLFNRSILANSFGECILENMYVLPIEMHGAPRIPTKESIGPVPALETFRTDPVKKESAASLTSYTNGSDGLVLAAPTLWNTFTSMSSNPFNSRWRTSRAAWRCGSMPGISRKSIFAVAWFGRTVFAPSPT